MNSTGVPRVREPLNAPRSIPFRYQPLTNGQIDICKIWLRYNTTTKIVHESQCVHALKKLKSNRSSNYGLWPAACADHGDYQQEFQRDKSQGAHKHQHVEPGNSNIFQVVFRSKSHQERQVVRKETGVKRTEAQGSSHLLDCQTGICRYNSRCLTNETAKDSHQCHSRNIKGDCCFRLWRLSESLQVKAVCQWT